MADQLKNQKFYFYTKLRIIFLTEILLQSNVMTRKQKGYLLAMFV